MFPSTHAFSGFSVNGLSAAASFYGDKLGLEVQRGEMGITLVLPGGARVFVYEKANHEPASFTILNFAVDDIDTAVDQLNAAGITTKIYDDSSGLHTDDKGIARGGRGPDIAWFTDPAGNVLSVLKG